MSYIRKMKHIVEAIVVGNMTIIGKAISDKYAFQALDDVSFFPRSPFFK